MPGCTTATHRWFKPKEATAAKCRHDWIQTGDYVTVTIFSKAVDPSLSSITLNDDTLSVKLVFEGSNKFDAVYRLAGTVDPTQAVVTAAGTKVDIKMKKKDAASWPKLTIDE